MNFKRLVVFLFLAIFLVSCTEKEENEESTLTNFVPKSIQKSISVSQYPIVLQSIDGKSIEIDKIEKGFSFSGFEDKAVLLNFFVSWCPPCKAEIPHLNNLQKKYADKLEIIGVLLEEKSKEDIAKIVEQYEIAFRVTYGKANFKLAKKVGDVGAIPFMILYDKKGQYATHYVGAVPEEMMDIDIQKVVK